MMPSRPVPDSGKRKFESGFDEQRSMLARVSGANGSSSPQAKKLKSRKIEDNMAANCNPLDNQKADDEDDDDWAAQTLPPRRASRYELMDIPIIDDEEDSDYQPGSQESTQPSESTRRMRVRRVDFSPSASDTAPVQSKPSSLPRGNRVQVFPGIAYEMITIMPGQSRSWKAARAKRRVATILEGKLRIRSYGEVFELGPGGMFKIVEARSGNETTTTVVENGLYINAVVQLMAIDLDVCICGQ